MLRMYFLLICIHALTDFQLQNGAMWQRKTREHSDRWYQWLIAHALICGGGVYLATDILALGIVEVVCHCMIDFWKGERWIDSRTDQIFHVACRIVYVLIWMGVTNV